MLRWGKAQLSVKRSSFAHPVVQVMDAGRFVTNGEDIVWRKQSLVEWKNYRFLWDSKTQQVSCQWLAKAELGPTYWLERVTLLKGFHSILPISENCWPCFYPSNSLLFPCWSAIVELHQNTCAEILLLICKWYAYDYRMLRYSNLANKLPLHI